MGHGPTNQLQDLSWGAFDHTSPIKVLLLLFVYVCEHCVCVFVGSYLATKVFIGNLPATGRGLVIIKLAIDDINYLVHPN